MIVVEASSNVQVLLHPEFDSSTIQGALCVIDVDHCPGYLCWSVGILFVGGPHLRVSLINAAPSLNVSILHLLLVCLEGF